MMDEKSGTNQDSGSPDSIRDEDRHLLTLSPKVQLWPNTPVTPNPYDTLPSPGAYYTTIQSTSSRRSRNYRPGSYRKIRRRAVLKNGECNVVPKKISRRRRRFLQDIFTTLVDSQWRWTLIVFALGFILSWLLFAIIYWLIAVTHGDLEANHLPANQIASNWIPCVVNINNFASCLLFSIETQHTIGYGGRATTEECPEAIFIMSFQSIFGVFVQAFMAGIVFAKMTRPKQRTQTLLFSKYAVVCQRDDNLVLMFRVGDIRKSHIIGANIRAQLIRSHSTKEGELNPQYITELDIGTDGCASDLFFIWPMVVVHRIDETSPFYNMSAADMLHEKFEIVVILEGTIESTGQTTQARSSYLNMEVLWGHRFLPVVGFNNERQGYDIDYSKFNETLPVDTPLCSAHELAEFYKRQEDMQTPKSFGSLPSSYRMIIPTRECGSEIFNYVRPKSLSPVLPAFPENPNWTEQYPSSESNLPRHRRDPCKTNDTPISNDSSNESDVRESV
ncbi:G protein-activated inward rectifier potassium channel 3-like [Contarinia nasturtii]|uniref:G protein-activated inward rectifier potassium channel 3-like n=1 Tax=Contarinia nasturtii TaxID=265458 RepID=UPI0012D42A85|nr:G protein-activated inward rectifier potassium channel 3-like [Contarinia nasturtii]XP_031638581.1 G protein-activated inward rectifier potassium channel 3-like [Contarinia nasturtii]